MAKTYEKYKDCSIPWIGKIPSDWSIDYLGKIGVFTASGIDKKINEKESLVHIINYTDVYGNTSHELLDIDYMLVSAPKEKCEEHQVEEGDMIFTPSSETIEDIGVSAVVMKALPNTAYSYHVLRYKNNTININFKKYICNNHLVQNYFSSRATGSIRKTLDRQDFKECKVIVPPLNEQAAIGKYLDTKCSEMDSLICLQEEMISELLAYKQSVITETITKGLDSNSPMKDSGIEWIGEIPAEWNICRFKAVAKVKANLVHPDNYLEMPQIAPDCIEKGSGKLIKIQTVKEANVISDNHLFFKGQILYSKIRPALNKVIIAPFDGLCCADMYPIETSENLKFFHFVMLSSFFNNQVSVVVQDRVKMPKINKEELDQILIIVPPITIQEKIVVFLEEKVGEIDSLISLKQEKIKELNEYKKSIIYEYVTGKKRV